jgi:hypothetical protein
MEELHLRILEQITRLIVSEPTRNETYGRDLVDLPADELILYGVKLAYPGGGPFIKSGKFKTTETIELTKTTEAARPTFEWLAEITMKHGGEVEHYLLRPDGSIVETYGKNVYAATPERAESLLRRLTLLAA